MKRNAEKNAINTLAAYFTKKWILAILAIPVVLSSAYAAGAVSSVADAGKVVLASGNVTVAGKAAQLNSVIQEGTTIKTGVDGYLYVKTVDNGFLILRPNSEVRIVSYFIDSADTTKTRIKFELVSGVARSISGEAVKSARQNFRFNTPVAAIGVRGTDFTVFTSQEVTRVSVYSGGVVASGFGQNCFATGSGPCEGANSAELFARQQGLLLEIHRDQMKPQILTGNGLAPDAMSPPRSDEPSKLTTGNANAINVPRSSNIDIAPSKVDAALQTSIPTVIPLVNTIIWGRWKEVLGANAEVDIQKQSDAQSKVVAINNYYVLFRSKNSEGQLPNAGSFGFALKDSQAVVFDESKELLTPATIENAKLTLNFSAASFNTSFDLLSNKEKYALQSQGTISNTGVLTGEFQYSYPTNMAVSGVVTAEKGLSAAYIFQSRLDNNRLASGITNWSRK